MIEPRLVPKPLWGISAMGLLPRATWRQIRQDALDASGGACVACGVVRAKGMVGDEEWGYARGVATLTGVRILCPDCDAVTHIGSTAGRGYGEVARDHMARVNRTTIEDANAIIRLAVEQWRERSTRRWTLAVAPDLLGRYPELAVLRGARPKPQGR